MEGQEAHEEFKKSIKYKNIGLIIILLSMIPPILWRNILGYVLAAITFGIGVYFQRQYKCPFCGHVFDSRIKPDDLKYCSKCSRKLQ